MKKIMSFFSLGFLLAVSLGACKTLEPAQVPNWSGPMSKSEMATFLPGKTFTTLDVGGEIGDGNTVVLSFDGDLTVSGKSTSGASKSGKWNLREYKNAGLVCMKWSSKGWVDWCFKLVNDKGSLKFNELSDTTKFQVNKVEQEAKS